MLQSCFLDLDFSKFLEADYTVHTGSCIKHQVHELEDVHKTFGGFPQSYCQDNTTIHQLWWSPEDIDYLELQTQLGMEVITVSSIRQPPGNVVPIHRDTFFQINQRHPARTELKVRANIYLEDWKAGHMVQYEDEQGGWKVSTHWRAGQGLIWDSGPLHVSCNAGFNHKHTLQISGFLKTTI